VAPVQGGLQRGLKDRERTVVLFSDATILTETPPLRACWSRVGEAAEVAISGNRRKAALYGTINIATGRRCVEAVGRWNGQTWRDHLQAIRRTWRGWNIVLFLDRGSPHTANASRQLAFDLNIELRWLPTACPELNPVEDVWRWLKGVVLCNHQPDDFNETVASAVEALLELTPAQILNKAGILSQNFWLPT
jgi:DDE superfamily endonuclease